MVARAIGVNSTIPQKILFIQKALYVGNKNIYGSCIYICIYSFILCYLCGYLISVSQGLKPKIRFGCHGNSYTLNNFIKNSPFLKAFVFRNPPPICFSIGGSVLTISLYNYASLGTTYALVNINNNYPKDRDSMEKIEKKLVGNHLMCRAATKGHFML